MNQQEEEEKLSSDIILIDDKSDYPQNTIYLTFDDGPT